INKDKKILVKESVDRKTGFIVKSEAFSKVGRPLVLTFYAKLKINPRVIPLLPADTKHMVLKLENFEELSEKTISFFESDKFDSFIEKFNTKEFKNYKKIDEN